MPRPGVALSLQTAGNSAGAGSARDARRGRGRVCAQRRRPHRPEMAGPSPLHPPTPFSASHSRASWGGGELWLELEEAQEEASRVGRTELHPSPAARTPATRRGGRGLQVPRRQVHGATDVQGSARFKAPVALHVTPPPRRRISWTGVRPRELPACVRARVRAACRLLPGPPGLRSLLLCRLQVARPGVCVRAHVGAHPGLPPSPPSIHRCPAPTASACLPPPPLPSGSRFGLRGGMCASLLSLFRASRR